MSDLAQIVKRAQGLHTAIGNDVFKSDARLWCTICGDEKRATQQDLVYYLRHGWPKHCGQTMRMEMIKGDE